jgi:hypothetical protein
MRLTDGKLRPGDSQLASKKTQKTNPEGMARLRGCFGMSISAQQKASNARMCKCNILQFSVVYEKHSALVQYLVLLFNLFASTTSADETIFF